MVPAVGAGVRPVPASPCRASGWRPRSNGPLSPSGSGSSPKHILAPATAASGPGPLRSVAELKALGVRPLPALRTTPAPTAQQVRVERVRQRHGITVPRVRLARFLSDQPYPLAPPHDSNQVHQLDLVGPIRFA